ncbi:MAG: S-layer homology domain-containing protein, partial [Clostridiales bacterium]|nr:S-layer homology domain-containing protein [Clostridiales bacterium]
TSFTDVPAGQWYSAPIAWAASEGIVSGFAGKFRPNAGISRQETAAVLYRYAKLLGKGPQGNWAISMPYPDTSDISSWASEPSMWATATGIIPESTDHLFDPNGSVNRAQAALMLARFFEVVQ